MSLSAVSSAVVQHVITAHPDLTVDTCKVNDESVFEYMLTNGEDECCVIAIDKFFFPGTAEFQSVFTNWNFTINAFFHVKNSDYLSSIDAAMTFVDNMVDYTKANNTLGGTVLDFKIKSGGPILSYKRGVNYYILAPIDVVAEENI